MRAHGGNDGFLIMGAALKDVSMFGLHSLVKVSYMDQAPEVRWIASYPTGALRTQDSPSYGDDT